MTRFSYMSREAVQNLSQHIRVGTAHDGAESCSSKTLRWTARLRKQRSFADGSGNGSNRPVAALQGRSCERAVSAGKRTFG